MVNLSSEKTAERKQGRLEQRVLINTGDVPKLGRVLRALRIETNQQSEYRIIAKSSRGLVS